MIKEQWESTFNAIPDIVMILDLGFHIVNANQATCQFFDTTLEEVQGKPCYQLFCRRNGPCEWCPIRKAVHEVKSCTTEIVHANLGKTFSVSASPLVDSLGEVCSVVHFAKDITEEKSLAAQLLQAQKMEAIGTLAGGVAHDFNNVLSAIHGYLDLAMQELQPDIPAYADLQEVKSSAGRAANIVKQLLLFSRKQPMQIETINLNDGVNNILNMLQRFIGEDVSMETDLAADLWSINVDLTSLDQVIMNLVVNARDAMPKGGRIIISTENLRLDEDFCRMNPEARPGNFVRLSITDTGTGIDLKTQQHIFEPFFTTKKTGKGTGLGLAVTYGVVKEHQGWITVYSDLGRGTTFKVYLPAAVTEGTARSRKKEINLQNIEGKGERILLVEDDESIRDFITRALVINKYIVVPAENAEEAVEIFAREKGEFDLVFSDVVLPGKNGLEFVGELLEISPDLPVLLCSGYADEKSQLSVIKEREFPFIAKPFLLKDLLIAVRKALGGD